MCLSLQAVDVLGDDGVERQRASLGDAEYALGMLLEVGDGDVRPRIQRAIAARYQELKVMMESLLMSRRV